MRNILIFGTILTLTLLTAPVQAEVNISSEGANYLVEVGEQFYKTGDLERAISDFQKALMMDPNNEKAKHYLEELGIPTQNYPGFNTSKGKLIQMGIHLKGYKQRVKELDEQKAELDKKLNSIQADHDKIAKEKSIKEEEYKLLEEKMITLKKNNKSQARDYNYQIAELEREHKKQLKSLQKEKSKEHANLIDELRYLSERNRDLEQFNEGLHQGIASALNPQEYDSNEEMSLLKEEVEVQRAHQDNMFGLLEDYLYVRSNELSELNDELLVKELDLTRNQHKLLTRMDELVALSESVEGYQEQSHSKEELIETKRREVLFLAEELEQAKSDLEATKQKIDELESR